MAVYNWTDGTVLGAKKPHDTTPRGFSPFTLRNYVDLDLQTLDAGDGDSALVLNIPANVLVTHCYLNVRDAGAANSTCDLGITGGNVDQWGDALALSALGIAATAIEAPYFFLTAGTIQVLATTDGADVDLTSIGFEVIASCLKMSDTIDADQKL